MTERMSGVFRRILYFALILIIAVSAVKVYMLWWGRYEALNPQVIAATPYAHTDKIPARGILIWREEIVSSRWDGPVDYPSMEPRRVGRGETVAVIGASSGRMAVKAEKVGYFIPALDGVEGKWTYSAFWNGMAPLPEPPEPVFFSPGGFVEKGTPVGKIILQPQDLRCILYADVTPALEKDIRSGTVRVKTKDGEWPGKAEVRVASFHGSKVKLYLTLPFFPPDLAGSRGIRLLLEAGERAGVSLPESAVVYREGKLGVFSVEGNRVEFREITGTPVEGGRFFITEGLKPGNIAVLNARSAKEGKIRLW